MPKDLVPVKRGHVCRTRLDFLSLVKITALVGFCAGVVSVPIFMLLQSDKWFSDIFLVLFAIVASPLVGLINGVIFAVIGYPLYAWITRRVNVHTYTGEFEIYRQDAKEV